MAGTGHRPAIGTTWLVGDIGATNARFGLVAPGGALLHSNTYACDDFATIDDAIRAYLDTRGDLPMPRVGALAIAAAITGDQIRMTNHPWSFSVRALRDRLGFERLVVINDFTAVALAVPLLAEADRLPVGGGAPVARTDDRGAWSGLGARRLGLVPRVQRLRMGRAVRRGRACDDGAGERARERRARPDARAFRPRLGRARASRGPASSISTTAWRRSTGCRRRRTRRRRSPTPRSAQQDPLCREATAMFCAMLGTVAGNLALSLGAQGGVYIAGGIVPKLGSRFAESAFRERFEAKGRMRPYLAAIPTYVITHRLPAFLGCAAELTKLAR